MLPLPWWNNMEKHGRGDHNFSQIKHFFSQCASVPREVCEVRETALATAVTKSGAIERVNIGERATFVRQFIVHTPRRECKITRRSQSYVVFVNHEWYKLPRGRGWWIGREGRRRCATLAISPFSDVATDGHSCPKFDFLIRPRRRCVLENAKISLGASPHFRHSAKTPDRPDTPFANRVALNSFRSNSDDRYSSSEFARAA